MGYRAPWTLGRSPSGRNLGGREGTASSVRLGRRWTAGPHVRRAPSPQRAQRQSRWRWRLLVRTWSRNEGIEERGGRRRDGGFGAGDGVVGVEPAKRRPGRVGSDARSPSADDFVLIPFRARPSLPNPSRSLLGVFGCPSVMSSPAPSNEASP